MMPDYIPAIFIALLGLCAGSFINVCIARLPKDESIVKPRSHCPLCGTTIRFYDNIPLLSYFLLLGRCRHCKGEISFRYPAVEALTSAVFSVLYHVYSLTAELFIYMIFAGALIIVSGVDITDRIIPDEISLGLIPVGLLGSFVTKVGIYDSFIGAIVGGGSLYIIAWSYEKLKGEEGMGGGDIKLLAMIGSFIGFKGVAQTLFLGSLIGAIGGGLLIVFWKKGRKYPIPFGVFLSLAALIFVVAGDIAIRAYMDLMRWIIV